MMLRRRAGGLPDIRRDGEEEDREGVDEEGELREERDREHEDNGGGGGGEKRDREHENNGRGGGENGQTEQLENRNHLVAGRSDLSSEMPLNEMDNELADRDVANMRSDSITERLAKRDITGDEEDIPLINNIGEEENVHASIRHMAELIEEEEEEVPLIITEDDEDENASIEGADGNREEANPVVSQGMARGEEGNIAIVSLTTSSEENKEEELTILS